jgi:hypothetical protein
MLVPYSFKWVTDALNGAWRAALRAMPLLIAGPVALVLFYNVGPLHHDRLRAGSAIALFARVGLHAVRQLAYRTFQHLHDLSAPLPPRAAHRRPVAHHRARHDRHREHRPPRHLEHHADGDRVRADRGDRLVPVRLLVRRG